MVEPLARENMPHCFYGHLQETRPTDLGIDKVISTAICLSPRPNPKKKLTTIVLIQDFQFRRTVIAARNLTYCASATHGTLNSFAIHL